MRWFWVNKDDDDDSGAAAEIWLPAVILQNPDFCRCERSVSVLPRTAHTTRTTRTTPYYPVLRYCIKMTTPILKLFRPSGSPTILVSSDSCRDTQFQGEPFSGGVKYTGVGKLAIFDGNRRLFRKRCETGRWLLWNVNVMGAGFNCIIFDDLEWPLTPISRSRHFSTLNISETTWNRAIEHQ